MSKSKLGILISVALLAACGNDSASRLTSPQFVTGSISASSNAASSFAVLARTAVTCTDATINGDVGEFPGNTITQTSCVINGSIHAGDQAAGSAVSAFNTKYAALAATPCGTTLTTLDGQTLSGGVYCFDAAATSTNSVLTLTGSGPWLFKIGTLGTGALTGTGFSVVMADGSPVPCDMITWWVAQAATLTDSQFVGTIYAGASITITRGSFSGNAYAKDAVTITGAILHGCAGGSVGGSGHGGKCNQGVGNGPEGCDPGNSNNHNPTNDESGGTPGNPGRKTR